MSRKRLLWQLFPTYLLITLAALGTVTWYFSEELGKFHLEQTRIDLEARARLLVPQLTGLLDPASASRVEALCRELGRQTRTRITVVIPTGEVLGDSVEEADRMDNHADRPEIVAALRGEMGVSTRFSHTVNQNMMYVAAPVTSGGKVLGSVRTAIPLTSIDRTLKGIYARIAGGGLAVALAVALLSLAVSRRISRPLEEMKRGAQRFARGELDRLLPVSGSEEIGALAGALNLMAAQLDERIRSMVRQRNEQEAVLTSMVEGVLAVDIDERIIRLNRAAARLLEVTVEGAQGRPIQEVVRKTDLQRFVARALENRKPVEGDIVLRYQDRELFLQAHGTPLRDAGGRDIGALVVLNDVTRLRRLENVRRDFVANVSHELKTPITAIKGSVETLMGGAVEEPEAARRFLQITLKQAERLNAIIDDLLALSRVEQGAEKGGIVLEVSPLRPVLEAAVQACAHGAREKNVRVDLVCDPALMAPLNPPLLEQAVINLLTNALKYSEAQGTVEIDADVLEEEVRVRVRDWGCGIPREHLPRLFERFYRVDQARSRKLGGTGLGLAIVNHIIQAHCGRVTVDSVPGEGSVFTLVLPLKTVNREL